MIESKNSILEFWDPLLSLNPPCLTTSSIFLHEKSAETLSANTQFC